MDTSLNVENIKYLQGCRANIKFTQCWQQWKINKYTAPLGNSSALS